MSESVEVERSASVEIGAPVVIGKGKHLGRRGTVVDNARGWYKVQLAGVDGIANIRGAELTAAEPVAAGEPPPPSSLSKTGGGYSTRRNSPSPGMQATIESSPITRRSLRTRSPSPLKDHGDGRGEENANENEAPRASKQASPTRTRGEMGLPPRHPWRIIARPVGADDNPGTTMPQQDDETGSGTGSAVKEGQESPKRSSVVLQENQYRDTEETETDEKMNETESVREVDCNGGLFVEKRESITGREMPSETKNEMVVREMGELRKRGYGDSSSEEDKDDNDDDGGDEDGPEQEKVVFLDMSTKEKDYDLSDAANVAKQRESVEPKGGEEVDARQAEAPTGTSNGDSVASSTQTAEKYAGQGEGKGKCDMGTATEASRTDERHGMDVDLSDGEEQDEEEDEEAEGLDLDAMINLAATAAREHTANTLRGVCVASSPSELGLKGGGRGLYVGKKRPLFSSAFAAGAGQRRDREEEAVARKRQGWGIIEGGSRGGSPRGMLDSGLPSPKYLRYSRMGGKGQALTASVASDVMDSKAAKLMAGSALYTGGDRAMLLERTKAPKDTTAGNGWFNMEEAKMTPELKRDLQVIRMRNYVDPKRFYKASDKVSKFVQVGTVKEGPGEFFSSRLTNKERKKTLVDELLVADEKFRAYSKSQSNSIQQRKRAGGKAHYNQLKRKQQGKGWRP